MTKNRIKEIEQLLRKASNAYYGGQNAILSDAEFDKLRDELEDIDPHNAFLAEIGAPTESSLTKVKHTIRMGSLKKINTAAEFSTWQNTISKSVKDLQMVVQLKLDGLSIEIVYENGKFKQAITRGDGNIGEDITHTIRKAKGYPKTISIKDRQVFVRCEALLPIAEWKKYFANKANPRNAASGIVRRTDAKGAEHICCIAFDVLFDDHGFKTEQSKLTWLDKQGFKTTSSVVVVPDDVEKTVQLFQDKRDSLPIEIDGTVVKLNNIAEQKKLGEHNGRPYWARAWKFAPMGGHTILTDVEWTVGVNGNITPIAVVEPVTIGGVSITRITLHNAAQLEQLDVNIGDKIEVIRAGDVIPYIVRVVEKKFDCLHHHKPECKHCPACGGKVNRVGPMYKCINDSCVGVQFKRIQKWIKKREIMYLGDSNLKALFNTGTVTDIPDLYDLTVLKMTDAGIGQRMSEKIIEQIDKSRECELADLIGSLSLDMLGRAEALNLINHGIDTLDKWKNLTVDQIGILPGYQKTKATRIVQAIMDNWELIEKIAACLTVKKKDYSGKLSGMTFCFTGSMKNSRKKLENMVKDAGGKVHNNVSKGLTYLVIADPQSMSSKAMKARKLGIRLISENDFLKLV